jgi:hypothetical protein
MHRSTAGWFAAVLVSVAALARCGSDSNPSDAATGGGPSAGGSAGAASGAAGSGGIGSGGKAGGGGTSVDDGGTGGAGTGGGAGQAGHAGTGGSADAGACPEKAVAREGCKQFNDFCRYPQRECTCMGHDLGVLLWECVDTDGGRVGGG